MGNARRNFEHFAGGNDVVPALCAKDQLSGFEVADLFVGVAVFGYDGAFGEKNAGDGHAAGMDHLAGKSGVQLLARDRAPLMQLHGVYHTGNVPVLVNGERIEDQTIREEARAIRPKLTEAMAGEDPRTVEARVKQWARENVIERVVLQQAAWGDPEPVPAEAVEGEMADIRPENGGCIAPGTEEQTRKEIELRFRIDRLFDRACANLSEPRNKDITEFYRKHREQFVLPASVHAAHVVKNIEKPEDEAAAREAIEAAYAEIQAGGDFAAIADRVSDCPGNGGDLGWFPMGEMVDDFEAVVFRMQAGEISPVFRTPFGFHVAKVIDKREPGPASLEDVRDRIAEAITQEKRQKLIEQYLDKLISSAKIEEVAE